MDEWDGKLVTNIGPRLVRYIACKAWEPCVVDDVEVTADVAWDQHRIDRTDDGLQCLPSLVE